MELVIKTLLNTPLCSLGGRRLRDLVKFVDDERTRHNMVIELKKEPPSPKPEPAPDPKGERFRVAAKRLSKHERLF
jgi:hypothetical protein